MNKIDLTNKTAIVTGGAQGFGLAISKRFIDSGCKVVIWDKDEKLLDTLKLENTGWQILSQRWIFFFIFVAILNEIVWRTQSEIFWVNFKVWGLLPITFLFVASQIPLINKYRVK